MPAYMSVSYVDASNEPASTKIYLLDATSYANADSLRAAMGVMSDMLQRSWQFGVDYPLSGAAGVGSRELKLLVRCHDSVTQQKYSFTIPGFDTDLDLIPGTDFVDPSDPLAAAFITAAELIVRTPWANNAIVVDSIEKTRGLK